jgi:FimV-like protein
VAALVAVALFLVIAALGVASFSLMRALRRDAEAVAAARPAAGAERVTKQHRPAAQAPTTSADATIRSAQSHRGAERISSKQFASSLRPTGRAMLIPETAAAFHPPMSWFGHSLSQLDAIGDVDPVAEADVYLAYGRDLQAEEILKEAMRGNPDRLAIRTKLLEVYAKRRDTKGFEQLATQLYSLTNGDGEDWLKTQELGKQIDPDNRLYQRGRRPAAVVGVAAGGTAARLADRQGDDAMLVEAWPPLQELPPFDLGGISLDLDETMSIKGDERAIEVGGRGDEGAKSSQTDSTDPLSRKLEMAEEFRQIGDNEGARDLLEEIVTEAKGSLQARAKRLLDKLA